MPLLTTIASGGVKGLGWSASAGEELGGMVLLTPTSIDVVGTSATVGANGSVEFSAITSLRLNGIFSADYDNYVISIRATSSIDTGYGIRLSSGGTDENAPWNYYTRQVLSAYDTTIVGARVAYNYFRAIGISYNVTASGTNTTLYGPYLAQPTALRSTPVTDDFGARFLDGAHTHSLSNSYDGINLFPESGNITGLISVYGLVGA